MGEDGEAQEGSSGRTSTRTFRPELVQRPRRGQTREAGADHDVLRLLVHRGERDGMCLGVSKATTKK